MLVLLTLLRPTTTIPVSNGGFDHHRRFGENALAITMASVSSQPIVGDLAMNLNAHEIKLTKSWQRIAFIVFVAHARLAAVGMCTLVLHRCANKGVRTLFRKRVLTPLLR